MFRYKSTFGGWLKAKNMEAQEKEVALGLLAVGLGYVTEGGNLLGWFICAHFLAWGVVHLLLGLTSGLPHAPARMFQWVLFLAVAATAGFGLAKG